MRDPIGWMRNRKQLDLDTKYSTGLPVLQMSEHSIYSSLSCGCMSTGIMDNLEHLPTLKNPHKGCHCETYNCCQKCQQGRKFLELSSAPEVYINCCYRHSDNCRSQGRWGHRVTDPHLRSWMILCSTCAVHRGLCTEIPILAKRKSLVSTYVSLRAASVREDLCLSLGKWSHEKNKTLLKLGEDEAHRKQLKLLGLYN